jgi:hypothetical protein
MDGVADRLRAERAVDVAPVAEQMRPLPAKFGEMRSMRWT